MWQRLASHLRHDLTRRNAGRYRPMEKSAATALIPALLHSPAQPQFPRNPLAHFPDTTRPLSLQPPIDWAVTLPLAGDFLKHLSTGHHKWWLTDSALFLPRCTSDLEPARRRSMPLLSWLFCSRFSWLVDKIHYTNINNEQGAEEYFLQCMVFFTITIVCRSAPHMSRDPSFLFDSVSNTLLCQSSFVLHQTYPQLAGPFLRDPYRSSLIP